MIDAKTAAGILALAEAVDVLRDKKEAVMKDVVRLQAEYEKKLAAKDGEIALLKADLAAATAPVVNRKLLEKAAKKEAE